MALKAIGNALAKLGVKAPWQITGPASHVEYKDAILQVGNAAAGRKGTPASQPMKVIIPHSETDNIFNTRYYNRKERLAAAMTPADLNHTPAPPAPSKEPLEGAVVPEMERPHFFGTPFRFDEKVALNDYQNNGYTR